METKRRETPHLPRVKWGGRDTARCSWTLVWLSFLFQVKSNSTSQKTNYIENRTVISSSRIYCRLNSYILFAESIIKNASYQCWRRSLHWVFKIRRGPGNPISLMKSSIGNKAKVKSVHCGFPENITPVWYYDSKTFWARSQQPMTPQSSWRWRQATVQILALEANVS